jgi:hypothetical protein
MLAVMVIINVIHPGIIKAELKNKQGSRFRRGDSPDVEALDMDVRQKH